MSLLKFDTIELISCMIAVKILKSWINVCALETILVICKNDIFSLIRKVRIRNGLKKSVMIVERMPWNEIHKIGIVKEFVSRTVNLSVRIRRGNRVKSIIVLVFGLDCRYYTLKVWIRFQCLYLFLIVDYDVDFIVVDVSGDVEFSVVCGDFGRDESGFVAIGDVEENIRSPVLVDEIEDDVRGAVGIGDVGSDGQIGLIFVCDVGCESEVTISIVEGGFEYDRAIFVVDGCVSGHRAVAVCH